MLKRYLLSELTRVFGKYVDGLDDESLQVGVWSGKIELAEVKLRKEPIDKLRLPLTVRGGYLKKLDVEVPWTSLHNTPVKVSVDTIVLLLCPNNVWATADEAPVEDCYQILGVGRDAGVDEIEAAFAALSFVTLPGVGAALHRRGLPGGRQPAAFLQFLEDACAF